MSMIHDQMWRLKATAKRLDASGDRDAAREIYLAVETINDLHTKLTAASMERSSAWYSGGWIPCEERLPESNGEYLVTSGNDSVDIHADNYTDGKWWWNFWEEDDRVKAWMPLPEPYKED